MNNLITVKRTNWEKSGIFRYLDLPHKPERRYFLLTLVAFDTEQGFEAKGYVKSFNF